MMIWDSVPSVSTQKDQRSLKEQLLDCVSDIEYIFEKIPSGRGKSQSDKKAVLDLVPFYDKNVDQLNSFLALVKEHQERENHIKELEQCVTQRNNYIFAFADELKKLEMGLLEIKHEASRKYKLIENASANKINSEDVIRLAYQISKSYSIASPNDWFQGDSRRPYPTQIDFASSALMRSSRERVPTTTNDDATTSTNINERIKTDDDDNKPSNLQNQNKLSNLIDEPSEKADDSPPGITINFSSDWKSKQDEMMEDNIEEMSSDSSLSSEDDDE